MHQAGGIIVPAPAARLFKAGAVAGLVAQGPDENRGAVFVPDDAPLHPVQDQRRKLLLLGDQAEGGLIAATKYLGHAVALHVSLVDEIEAVALAHLHKPGGVGVVAAADGVYVVLLHQGQVLQRLLVADGKAGNRVGIVAVYPL